MIAEANGLDRDCVLVGNGGDELLFDIALALGWAGAQVPQHAAHVLGVPQQRRAHQHRGGRHPAPRDYTIDEEAVLSRVARGGIDYVIVTSPNNPTGRFGR